MFEGKIGCKDRIGPKSKYPNIELKREFNAKNFRDSNRQITRLASTKAGTLRSYVHTTQPGMRSSTRKDMYYENENYNEMEGNTRGDDEIGESESQY